MSNMDHAVEHLIDAILNSEEYLTYKDELSKVKQMPQLKAQLDEYRKRNFILQHSEGYAFDKLEEFEREFQEFRENPQVEAFLAAELSFCRMMQDVETRITGALHFE